MYPLVEATGRRKGAYRHSWNWYNRHLRRKRWKVQRYHCRRLAGDICVHVVVLSLVDYLGLPKRRASPFPYYLAQRVVTSKPSKKIEATAAF